MAGMGILPWIGEHWFDLLQSVGIIGSLIFAAHAFRIDAKARYITNLIEFLKEHREIWIELYRHPALLRIFESKPDLQSKPMTPEEDTFVGFLILQLNASYQAMKNGMFISPQGVRKDIQEFFALPIPRAIWEKTKTFQNDDFVEFVERCLTEKLDGGGR